MQLHIGDAKKIKLVRMINLYYNSKPVVDLGELRNKWSMWKKIKSVNLQPSITDIVIELPIPVTATNFLIEYASFYDNLQVFSTALIIIGLCNVIFLQASSMEKLQCPRCSRTVTDKHGICKHCHENAFQCRQCRSIILAKLRFIPAPIIT